MRFFALSTEKPPDARQKNQQSGGEDNEEGMSKEFHRLFALDAKRKWLTCEPSSAPLVMRRSPNSSVIHRRRNSVGIMGRSRRWTGRLGRVPNAAALHRLVLSQQPSRE
jgi:hypothetical protein